MIFYNNKDDRIGNRIKAKHAFRGERLLNIITIQTILLLNTNTFNVSALCQLTSIKSR